MKWDRENLFASIRSLAQLSPLLAAIIAPFSTLMDIPALTQPWYALDGNAVPDFKASLVLSSVGLAFNFMANALLLARFSTRGHDVWWRAATRLSCLFWVIKLIVALVNLVIFGAEKRNAKGFVYLEGFWCAVVSLVFSGFVVFFLLLHWALEFNKQSETIAKASTANNLLSHGKEVRVFGRHFMLQVTAFVAGVGLGAFILSRIEGWAYFDGIYFSVTTALTVGFGDFTPATTAGRIILFPFAVFNIAQLANIIGSLIGFFKERTKNVTDQWRIDFEIKHHEQQDEDNPNPHFDEEIKFLESLYRRVEMRQQIKNIAQSVFTFLAFWLVGAVIFWRIEVWTYGDALYFCYVFLFAIGYGDFAPETNGGRVFFVVYSLIAVPIMTSFAIDTVANILHYVSNRRLASREKKQDIVKDPENGEFRNDRGHGHFRPHSELVLKAHRRISAGSLNEIKLGTASEEEKVKDETLQLAHHIMVLVCKLEGHSRRLLVGQMCESDDENIKLASMILKADWNVQRRELLTIFGEDPDPGFDLDGDGVGDFAPGARSDMHRGVTDGRGTLEEISKYRECFAQLLAAGSRLCKLEGEQQLIFERRKHGKQTVTRAKSRITLDTPNFSLNTDTNTER